MTFSILSSTLNFAIRLGQWEYSIVNDSDCMAIMFSAEVGPEGYCRCLCSFGDGLDWKKDDSQINEANKNYLRYTDHFQVITPNLRRSRCIAVLGVCTLVLKLPLPSDHVCNGGTRKILDCSGPRQSFQCCPARPAKFPEGKSTGFFSKVFGEKSDRFGEKSAFVILYTLLAYSAYYFSDIAYWFFPFRPGSAMQEEEKA